MITRLRAENFKSWKDTGDLRLGRLTGLFGTNSSGKTSILQILPLLKQTAEFPDRNRVLYTGNRMSHQFTWARFLRSSMGTKRTPVSGCP